MYTTAFAILSRHTTHLQSQQSHVAHSLALTIPPLSLAVMTLVSTHFPLSVRLWSLRLPRQQHYTEHIRGLGSSGHC